ncbi:MAG: sigma 54-interacting transcriptional regulator [Polyangia bacterium]
MDDSLPQTLERRYRRLRRLGSGAQGSVHLVEDRYLGGRRLALKVLRPRATEKWREAFRHEFEVLAGLRHPRLAAVHDFGTVPDGRVFFTRDFIAGDDLRASVLDGGIEKVIASMVEVCRALAPLHRGGLIHGDLKPANVIVGPDGAARLIDFSFVRASGRDAIRRGTAVYMAPEVIEEKTADARADLYSLGIAAFELVTGSPPFDGEVGAVVSGHLGSKRPPVAQLRPALEGAPFEIVGELALIIERLIARNPNERFPDAAEVEAALQSLTPEAGEGDTLPAVPVQALGEARERELRRVCDTVRARLDSPDENSVLIAVEGELGTGKSTILRGLKWWAQLEGISVIEVLCEGGGGLVDPLARLVEQAVGLLGEQEAERARAERLLQSLERPDAAGEGLDALAVGVSELVCRIGLRRPLLVLVEDVERASPESMRGLRSLVLGAGGGIPVAIAISAETGFAWQDELGPGLRVRLPLLDRRQVAELTRTHLGSADDIAVDRIMTHTAGNPMFVAALLQDLAFAGSGVEHLEELGPPGELESYWKERLERLDPESRRAVEASVTLDRPAGTEEIAGVAEASDSLSKRDLQRLEGTGWLRRGVAGWFPSSSALSELVRARIPAARASRMHRRAADVEPDEARRLLHESRCGELGSKRRRVLEVAESLERLGALDAARRLLEAALEALGEGDCIVEARLALGRIALAGGDFDSARELLEPLAAERELELFRHAAVLLGRMHGLRRELEAGKRWLRQALEAAEQGAERAGVLFELANVEFRDGDRSRAERTARRGLDSAPDRHPVRADLYGVLGKLACVDGRHEEALALCREAVDAARRSGDRRTLALAIDILSWVRQQSGDLAGAVEDLGRAASIDREIGDLPRLMRAQLVLGDLEWWLERWHAALGHYEEAMRLVGAVGNPVQRIEVRIGLGQALVKVGRFERAALLLEQARRDAERIGRDELRLSARVYEGDLAAARGRVDEALEIWSEARAGLEGVASNAVVAEIELEMAGQHLWRGTSKDIAVADSAIQSAAGRRLEDLGRRLEDLLEMRRAEIALAKGRVEEGMLKLDDLAERFEREGSLDLTWQVDLAAGRSLIARGSEVLARKRLRRAERALEKLAGGLPAEHRLAFWQDVRRAEVRRMLAVSTPSSLAAIGSGISSSAAEDLDPEARALYRVLEINQGLSSETDLDRLMEMILNAAVDLTRAERGLVLVPGDGGLEVAASRDLEAGDGRDPAAQFSRSISESVYLDGEAVVTVDALGDDRFNEFLSIHELKIRSVACLPVQYRGRTLGVLYLENRLRSGRFGGSDLRVLRAFAGQVAVAISQARMLEESRQRQIELSEAKQALESLCGRLSDDLRSKGEDLRNVREQLRRVHRRVAGEGDYHGVIGSGAEMRRVFELVERVKDLDVPVVFVGESGTGKDLLARVLHDAGSRGRGPFVSVSCGGIPETLVESTLFGHTRGAFSGADSERPGLIAAAAGGTLYFDDIGEMSPRMQIDLLRVLQEGCFVPLGGQSAIRADFRLVASSRLPLERLVEDGMLRSDLFYRLEVVSMKLPPLRDRRGDIPMLARRIIARESKRLGQTAPLLSRDAVAELVGGEWPGNVRELEQVLRRTLVVGEVGEELSAESIRGVADRPRRSKTGRRGRPPAEIDAEEEKRILDTLEASRWNRSEAARQLQIPRRTFYRRLAKLGLAEKRSRSKTPKI